MSRLVFEAQLRITDCMYNHGHICLVDDSIFGVFSLDYVTICRIGNNTTLNLIEYDLEQGAYLVPKEFVNSNCEISFTNTPKIYSFVDASGTTLSLEIIKRISNEDNAMRIIQSVPNIFKH